MPFSRTKLRRYRLAAGLTQAQLATLAEIHPITIQAIEAGRKQPHLVTVERTADALGVTIDELFERGAQQWSPLGELVRKPFSARVTKGHEQRGAYTRLVLGVPDSVSDEVATNDWHRQQFGAPALDEHSDLVRLKVAGLLAVWQGRLDLSEEDWQLAALVVGSSRKVRDRLRVHLHSKARASEKATAERLARRQVTVAQHTESWRVAKVSTVLADRVRKEPGKWSQGPLRKSLGKAQQEWFEQALEHALREGWLHEETAQTSGGPSRRLWPGRGTP